MRKSKGAATHRGYCLKAAQSGDCRLCLRRLEPTAVSEKRRSSPELGDALQGMAFARMRCSPYDASERAAIQKSKAFKLGAFKIFE